MAPVNHTFLFEPGVWTGQGTLWRTDGEPLETATRTEITHRPDCWLMSGTLKVLGSPPTEFVHAYLIEPPAPGARSVRWTFESATFGTLQGRFTAIGISILSAYECAVSGYHGAEHLERVDPGHYRSCGMLLLRESLVYSWEMRLKRAAH